MDIISKRGSQPAKSRAREAGSPAVPLRRHAHAAQDAQPTRHRLVVDSGSSPLPHSSPFDTSQADDSAGENHV